MNPIDFFLRKSAWSFVCFDFSWRVGPILDRILIHHNFSYIEFAYIWCNIVLIMGGRCSTIPTNNNILIAGSGNSAIMINGVRYNISRIFNNAVNVVVQKYRAELILVHLMSIVLMLTSIFLIIACLKSKSREKKGTIIEPNKKIRQIGYILFILLEMRSTNAKNEQGFLSVLLRQ